MDGGLVYGPNKAWTDAIREFKDGLLQIDEVKGPYGGDFPKNNSIRLPFINPPPPRDHPQIKPIKRFNSKWKVAEQYIFF
jgi:dual oxidase